MKDTYLLDNYSINFNGNLLNLNTPIVMSILNTTPDSFFDGGNYNSLDGALKKVEKDLEWSNHNRYWRLFYKDPMGTTFL